MSSNPFEKFDKPSEYLPEGKDESFYLKKIQARIGPNSNLKNLIRPSWMIGIAASLLIVSIYFLMNRNSTNPDLLAESSFLPYKNYQTEKTRGSEEIKTYQEAYQAYDEEDYSNAARLFANSFKQLMPLDKLYYAISLIASSDYKKANEVLIKIELTLAKQHLNAWLFYKSLCEIKSNRFDTARSLLEKMIDDNSPLSETGRKLLDKLY